MLLRLHIRDYWTPEALPRRWDREKSWGYSSVVRSIDWTLFTISFATLRNQNSVLIRTYQYKTLLNPSLAAVEQSRILSSLSTKTTWNQVRSFRKRLSPYLPQKYNEMMHFRWHVPMNLHVTSPRLVMIKCGFQFVSMST